MEVVYNGMRRIIREAVNGAYSILLNPQFYDSITLHSSFDYSTTSPPHIADLIYNSNITLFVRVYQSRRRNSRVLGYFKASHPNRLNLNSRRLNRRIEYLVATIIHESIHAVDHAIRDYSFGHKGNHSAGNQNSAPYWIGKLAGELFIGKSPAVARMNAENFIMDIDIEEYALDDIEEDVVDYMEVELLM